jgi:hypothetical protein
MSTDAIDASIPTLNVNYSAILLQRTGSRSGIFAFSVETSHCQRIPGKLSRRSIR